MRGKLQTFLAVAVAAALVAADGDKGDAAKKDLDALQGAWTITGGEVDGAALDPQLIQGGSMTVKGDRYTFVLGGMTEEGTFKIDPTKKPRTIDITIGTGNDKGKVQLGVYSLEGGVWKVCVGLPDRKDRPTELKTKAGTEQNMFILKKAKS